MSAAQITTLIGSNQFLVTLDTPFRSPSSNRVIERHNHIAFEFVYILEGSCETSTDTESHKLSAGQFSLTGPGVYHDQSSSGPVKKISFSIEHTKKHTKQNYFPVQEDELIIKALKSIELFVGTDGGTIIGLVHEIQEELSSKRFGYYSAMQSLISELIIALLRNISGDTPQTYDTPKRLSSDSRSTAIENFFEYNYNKKVSISDLSKLLFISNRQTVRILREKYNMSFKQKIIEMRIEVSKTLLKSTRMPIKQIAFHIGYETANFSAMFKQKTGISPKQYRQQNIDSNPQVTVP